MYSSDEHTSVSRFHIATSRQLQAMHLLDVASDAGLQPRHLVVDAQGRKHDVH